MLQRQIARMVRSMELSPGTVKAWEGEAVTTLQLFPPNVSPKIVYYRWVGSGRKRENGMKSYSLL